MLTAHSSRLAGLVATLALTFVSAAHAAEGYLSQPALFADRLIFVSERDLWTARIPADAAAPVVAHRLTNGAGAEGRPIISPDGTRIAFSAEYEGNVDVYVMPIEGGAPTRLTFHPRPDEPVAWTPDGKRIAFRSTRSNPLGRQELFFVDATGGMATRTPFGEGALIAFDPKAPDASRFAFCRWSNENWYWRRYRGGTAPDIWSGDVETKQFANLTHTRASDLFPNWVGDRIVFLSDRDGAQNIWSMKPDGGDVRQHTTFSNDPAKPTDPSTYEVRWLSADASGGPVVAFAQAGGIGLLDTRNDSVRRLNVDLVTDRAGTLPRFVNAMTNATGFSLSPTGDRVLIEARGELVTLPVGKPKKGVQVGARQITHESSSREWGATWLSNDSVACVTDAGGEQQLAIVAADGSAVPTLATTDRAQWLLTPVASPDGRFVAFGDKDLRLWLFDVAKRTLTEIDRSQAGEITDYSFSPDGNWVAWSKLLPNRMGAISIRSTKDDTRIDLSDGLTNDREPRWDPAGAFLWFLSDRHLDPVISGPDFEYVLTNMSQVFAVPLEAATPPPSLTLAAASGFDMKKWAEPRADDSEEDEKAEKGEKSSEDAHKSDAKDKSKGEHATAPAAKSDTEKKAEPNGEDDDDDDLVVKIDAAGIRDRIWRVPVEPGNYHSLVATYGGVVFLSDPTRGIADAEWPAPPLGEAISTLKKFSVLEAETKDVVEGIARFAANKDGTTLAWLKDGKFVVKAAGAEKEESIDPSSVQVHVDPRAEWAQMLDETWRLQRDFYWAPNMTGIDWNAMRERYRALLPKAGTRSEAADIMGQLISELGTSHTYIMGFDEPDKAKKIGVGLLGVDLVRDGNVVRIKSILPGRPGDQELISPLALPHLNVTPGSVLLSIDGRTVRPDRDPYELLQDRAGKPVVLEIADDAQGNNRRTIEVVSLEDETPLRYAAWVEANRRAVDEASHGTLGYVHVPDMDSDGLIQFSRLWFPQTTKNGMVVDIRDNGGGYVSQLVLARVARKLWAFQMPRQGAPETYPTRVVDGPSVVLIDQNAGSDGDIFPESIRINGIAPLIGTRTWGGVVGIRADKPYLDLGVSSQPEFAWLDPRKSGDAAWSVENDGVPPDIEVDITPGDRMDGKDPQLAKGIDVLLEKLKANPPRPAPSAPFPNRAKARDVR
ncbi:MAG: PDZ domain-containing protein [Phycisphaerales bacterium]